MIVPPIRTYSKWAILIIFAVCVRVACREVLEETGLFVTDLKPIACWESWYDQHNFLPMCL
jgi:8-oxo-dGTP pyrophosphatase MutT (NUDIX family)